jgi:hypothetical protein
MIAEGRSCDDRKCSPPGRYGHRPSPSPHLSDFVPALPDSCRRRHGPRVSGTLREISNSWTPRLRSRDSIATLPRKPQSPHRSLQLVLLLVEELPALCRFRWHLLVTPPVAPLRLRPPSRAPPLRLPLEVFSLRSSDWSFPGQGPLSGAFRCGLPIRASGGGLRMRFPLESDRLFTASGTVI